MKAWLFLTIVFGSIAAGIALAVAISLTVDAPHVPPLPVDYASGGPATSFVIRTERLPHQGFVNTPEHPAELLPGSETDTRSGELPGFFVGGQPGSFAETPASMPEGTQESSTGREGEIAAESSQGGAGREQIPDDTPQAQADQGKAFAEFPRMPQEAPHGYAVSSVLVTDGGFSPEEISPTEEAGIRPQSQMSADPPQRVLLQPVAQGANRFGDESPEPPTSSAWAERVTIEIDNEELRTVLALLARQLGVNILVSRSVQGTISATLRDVTVESALEALLRATGYTARRYDNYLFVGTPEECDRLEQTQGGLALRVYRPRFISAKELQSLLQPLVTQGVGIITVSSPPETGIASDTARTGGDAYAGGDVVIVRDYQAVLAQLDRLVAEVDVKPPQVAIEAMILAVRLDDEDRMGINFELFRDRPRFRLGWENPPATLADIRFDAGLKVAFLDGSVSSFVSALQQVRDTNVIAAPRLLVLNKHRAEIQIGKEQGYVSTTITETAASQSVDFLDTGTLLRIRPFVLGDRMIRLEVHPELSDGEVRELAGFTVPQKDITQVTTNVLVPDGATVVIGGLIRHELSSGGSQIPVLGSLPWVGALFRNRASQQLREEIIVLITPHIVDERRAGEEGLAARDRFTTQFATAAELATPMGRQNVARRFYRLAQAAWQRGDCLRARRMAELALYFDPHLDEARALRDAATLAANDCTRCSQSLPTQALPDVNTAAEGVSCTPPVFILPQGEDVYSGKGQVVTSSTGGDSFLRR